MSVHVWDDAVAKATRLFNEAPPSGSELERNLILEWQRDPAEFEVIVVDVCDDWKAGKINRPWPIVLWRLRQVNKENAIRSREVNTAVPRERLVHLAENYIRNAGLYEPDEASITDALFGPRGSLRAWADDEELVQRMIDLWKREHPRGVRADKESDERAAKHRAYMEKVAAEKALAVSEQSS